MKTYVPILAILGILGGAFGTLALISSVSPLESESTKHNMKITPEQEMELANFPIALRTLVETELATGNAIVEIGHSFPAPPAGAYIKLANQISTRERVDGGFELGRSRSVLERGD